MSRYTFAENLKIEYLKLKIKEIRFLEFEISNAKDEIVKIDTKLTKVSSINYETCLEKHNSHKNNENGILNDLLDKKMNLERKIDILSKELSFGTKLLNSLSPNVSKIAKDLFINKYTMNKICFKYHVTNPYQMINDELRYLNIDNF